MSLHTNGILALAGVNFRLIDDGLYTFENADPNNPNQLIVASTVDTKGTRNIKIERKQWLPKDASQEGAWYRDYRVIQIPKHSAMVDATIVTVGSQVAGLNTAALIAALRRGEK